MLEKNMDVSITFWIFYSMKLFKLCFSQTKL